MKEGIQPEQQMEFKAPPVRLGRVVVEDYGGFQRVHDYVSGWHPELGTLHMGWSGRETIVEREVFVPTVVFEVKESELANHMARNGDY